MGPAGRAEDLWGSNPRLDGDELAGGGSCGGGWLDAKISEECGGGWAWGFGFWVGARAWFCVWWKVVVGGYCIGTWIEQRLSSDLV